MSSKVTAKAAIGIQKPIEEVFEAIINPEIMSQYFISKGSGRMEEGSEVHWEFPEFEGSFPVSIKKMKKNELISFVWDPDSFVEIRLEKWKNGDTVVWVTEEGRQNDEAGIKWGIGQTEGWTNFLNCMKAWLEYGIHLRKGAYNYIKK